MKGVIRSRKSK